jgi:hypothetical protein
MKPKKIRHTTLRSEAGNMIASDPVNPDRTASFGDRISQELLQRLYKGAISHRDYFTSIDLLKNVERQLTHIYGGRRHGIDAAITFLLTTVRNRLS